MRKIFIKCLLAMAMLANNASSVFAQRVTDNLNRGLVAVVPRNGSGIFLSWRIQVNEYYDVTYNVYRNGAKLNDAPLSVSNFMDNSGQTTDTYTVRAVVNGVEQPSSPAATVFQTNPYTASGIAGAPAYLSIPVMDVKDRNGQVVYSANGQICQWNYTLNDVCMADLDGDGEVELIVKRINQTDASSAYPDGTGKNLYERGNTTAYTIIEAYKLNGQRLWWIDCGPNMVSLNSTELNCVAYDWDEDGKAEVLMRGADNMIIHHSDDTTRDIGDMSVNTRANDWTNAQYAWTHKGSEYLLYMEGSTGKLYNDEVLEYPLKRFEDDEKGMEEQQVWSPTNQNGGYGHRSSKYFFGAPCFDGRKASIFLARGIYTQTKMIALDVDKSTHKLTQLWYWRNKTVGSPWFGQGNHNFVVADVDEDGCDEIVYGSMTIDNNGKGLSTTGLGHGDAMHVSDMDPFRKGLEMFACNEDNPGSNYRDATTSEILYRHVADKDDGRALMGNFTNDFPGCVGRSNTMPVNNLLSATARRINTEAGAIDSPDPAKYKGVLNGRIYWDGDLLEEYYASPGTEKECMVMKLNDNRIMQTYGVAMNNDSKNNPCAQGDILGDWREELVLRSGDNKELRIYSTDVPTTHRIPSLWYDHEYRQAMVWQVCAYNQPPHASFFLGELEGITKAPLPLTNKYDVISTGGLDITSGHNGKNILLCNMKQKQDNTNETVWFGVAGTQPAPSPSLLVVNTSSVVSGNDDNNNITYKYNSSIFGHDGKPGDLTGNMRMVKQGDGVLVLYEREFSYSGDTEIWGGTLNFHGTLANSNVWMNRHTNLYFGGTNVNQEPAEIKQSLTMEYGATLYPSARRMAENNPNAIDYATATIGTLNMHEGSRIVFQISNNESDAINIGSLSIRTQEWKYGPKYLAPVFEIQSSNALADGKYKLGTLEMITSGSLSDIIVECNTQNAGSKRQIVQELNTIYLVIGEYTPIGAPEIAYNEVFKLDFETASSNNYGFTEEKASCVFSQYAKTDGTGTHCLHVDQNAGGGDRYANINLSALSSAFNSVSNYVFEFDWGLSPSNQNTSKTTVKTDGGAVLFYIETPGYGASTLYNATGESIGTITNDGSTWACPTKLSHFKVASNNDGTYLTVTYDGGEVVSDYQLSAGLQHITALETTLGRAYSHMAIDDIILYEKETSATLSDEILPLLYADTYKSLTISRRLKEGYNTFCIPFNTTAQEIAGIGAKAYAFDGAVENQSTVSLRFLKVDQMEANVPYILYAPAAVAVPNFKNVTVSKPESVSVGGDGDQYLGWRFVSNYTPALNMNGNYIVKDNYLTLCGEQSGINGMRAYIAGPSTAAAKPISIYIDDASAILDIEDNKGSKTEAIYSISGVPQKSLQKGMNIIRTTNGKVNKIYIK